MNLPLASVIDDMKLTIDKKVGLFITVVIFLFGSLLGIYVVEKQTALLNDETEEWATGFVRNLTANLEYPVLIRDHEAIARIAKAALLQKDVVFCRVEGGGSSLLYELGEKKPGPVKELTAPIIASTAAGAESLIFNAPQEKTQVIGKVFLAISFQSHDQKISDIKRTILTFVLVAGIVASLGTYLLLKRLIGRPVGRLIVATERIAAGDLAYRVPHMTRDEFEKLAAAFNQMAASLLAAQQELVRAEKLAVVGQLAANVGNELRNPLGVMNNAVFFLENALADADEDVREYLGIINIEIGNAQRVIADFVDFFRARTPKPKVIALRDIIDESIKQSAAPGTVSILLDIPETLPPLKADPAQMRQVFQNLITNAVQAMPEGGDLRISARRVESAALDGDSMAITVTDTGAGISPENLANIFQPLFSTKSRGIGLGLAICKNFVTANSGRIEVRSEPGKGAMFTVILPVAVPAKQVT